jgi:hypothetical protein
MGLKIGNVEILQGDCLEILKGLRSESVDCIVTSPPYWALRDYGTAEWEGGDPACDHTVKRYTAASTLKHDGRPNPGIHEHHKVPIDPFIGDCPRCGNLHALPGSTIPCFTAYAKERLAEEPEWLKPLRGNTLVCTGCGPGAPTCHARVLERLR